MKKILSIFFTILLFSHLHCGNNVNWSFPPTSISTLDVNASNPQVAMDGNANVFAAWVENGFVKSSMKPFNMNWSTIVTLSKTGASLPCLLCDLKGNAAAVWVESGVVKAATKPLNGNWTSSTALSSSGADLLQHFVSIRAETL